MDRFYDSDICWVTLVKIGEYILTEAWKTNDDLALPPVAPYTDLVRG